MAVIARQWPLIVVVCHQIAREYNQRNRHSNIGEDLLQEWAVCSTLQHYNIAGPLLLQT